MCESRGVLRCLAATLVGLLIVACAACSGEQTATADGEAESSNAGGDPESTTTVRDRPPGPGATIDGPLTGGDGTFLGAATDPSAALEEAGYTEVEYTAAGSASSYAGPTTPDGDFDLEPGGTAEYTTRIVVRRPADPEDFNGTVVVEWLNVSGGVDAAPDFTYLQDELLRGGYAWVGVSAQLIGIEGGPVAVEAPGAAERGAGAGLKSIDPARYGALSHPGDDFAFDIFTQVGRSLRAPGDTDALPGLEVERVLAVGESQSAFALTTYYNGVQPLTEAFDGFLVHSRGGAAMPIETASGYNDIAGSIGGEPTRFRTDLDAPVLVVQTEGDVLGLLDYLPARQQDADNLRIWEVAGTAHADLDQVGEQQEQALGCPTPINRGQQVFVLRAALRALDAWVAGGAAPPGADPLEVDDSAGTPAYVVDETGNVLGGVRTPAVEAPLDVLSGLAPPGSSVICLLFGSTTPVPRDALEELYEDREDYLRLYGEATDAAVEAGFVLEDDRDQLLGRAEPSRVPAS